MGGSARSRQSLIFAKTSFLKHLFFITLWLIALPVCGQKAAILEVLSEKELNAPFYLYLNGIRQNEAAATHLLVKEIPFEVYGAELRFPGSGEVVRKLLFLRTGSIKSYLLTKTPGSFELAEGPYTDSIGLYSRSITAIAFRDGQKPIDDGEAFETGDFTLHAPGTNFDDSEEMEESARVERVINADSLYRAAMPGETPVPEIVPTTCITSIRTEDIRLIRKKMAETAILRNRLLLATTNLSNKCLTVNQLKELMRGLEGDELKIELYRQVFPNVLDPEQKHTLYDLFYFESSIEEIRSFR